MSFDDIGSGVVIRYPYLWSREAAAGETEGRKVRPVAVAVRIARPNGADMLILFAITSRKPAPTRLAIEIPEAERRRAGPDESARLWIVLDEYNQDIVGASFYLTAESPLGRFSKAFFLPVLKVFLDYRNTSKSINRRR